MQYQRFGNMIALQLGSQDKIVQALQRLAKSENIQFAKIEGIGRVEKVVMGYFDHQANQYQQREIVEPCEMTSIVGNIAGDYQVHVHATVADDLTGETFGGHLIEAKINLVGELFITIIADEKILKATGENVKIPSWKFKNQS